MPDAPAPDHAARIRLLLDDPDYSPPDRLCRADHAAIRWLWAENERLAAALAAARVPEYVTIASAELAALRGERDEARAECEWLKGENERLGAIVQGNHAAACTSICRLAGELDEARAAAVRLKDLNGELAGRVAREAELRQEAERERDALIRSRVYHYATRPDDRKWAASEHTGHSGGWSWHATEAEAFAAVRKAAGLDAGGAGRRVTWPGPTTPPTSSQ